MRPDCRGIWRCCIFAWWRGHFHWGAVGPSDLAYGAERCAVVSRGMVIAVAVAATTGVPKGATQAPWRYLVLGGLFAVYFVG